MSQFKAAVSLFFFSLLALASAETIYYVNPVGDLTFQHKTSKYWTWTIDEGSGYIDAPEGVLKDWSHPVLGTLDGCLKEISGKEILVFGDDFPKVSSNQKYNFIFSNNSSEAVRVRLYGDDYNFHSYLIPAESSRRIKAQVGDDWRIRVGDGPVSRLDIDPSDDTVLYKHGDLKPVGQPKKFANARLTLNFGFLEEPLDLYASDEHIGEFSRTGQQMLIVPSEVSSSWSWKEQGDQDRVSVSTAPTVDEILRALNDNVSVERIFARKAVLEMPVSWEKRQPRQASMPLAIRNSSGASVLVRLYKPGAKYPVKMWVVRDVNSPHIASELFETDRQYLIDKPARKAFSPYEGLLNDNWGIRFDDEPIRSISSLDHEVIYNSTYKLEPSRTLTVNYE